MGTSVSGRSLRAAKLGFRWTRFRGAGQPYRAFRLYDTREVYLRLLAPQRIELIRNAIDAAPRRFVLAYGKAYWDYYAHLFPEAEWTDLNYCRLADLSETRIVLTPHFSSHCFNTDASLAAFFNSVTQQI